MKTEFLGAMRDFVELENGSVFCTALDGNLTFAMKIVYPFTGVGGVLSFSKRPHPTVAGPTLLEPVQFENRTVLHLPDAVFRLTSDPSQLNFPTLPGMITGMAIVSPTATYVRVHHYKTSYDVDVALGAARVSDARPGSVWTNSWQIFLIRDKEPDLLLINSADLAAEK